MKSLRSLQIATAVLICLALSACKAANDQLIACKYEPDKVIALSPPCPESKFFCEQERRGSLVQSCMEASGYRLNKPLLESTAQASRHYIEFVLANDPAVWDAPILGKPVRDVSGPAFIETYKMKNVFTGK